MNNFYDLKSELTDIISQFKKSCELDGRDFKDELDDCIADAERS